MTEMRKILINKSMRQLRVACTVNTKLYDLEIESIDQDQKVDRICNGEIVSIEPSLEAAFVDIGATRNAFLPLKEVASEYLKAKNPEGSAHEANINDLFIGQKVLIQVNKEERGTKGAALTTFISLAGCYLVLMPNNPKAGGISKRIVNEDRDELRAILSQLKIPTGMGVIVRTNGAGRTLDELQWDLDRLVKLWEAIQSASKNHGAPYLIHQESDLVIRTIRDYLRPDVSEIIIDDKETYEKAKAYVEIIRPEFVNKIKFYEGPSPLFSRYQIESQIEQAFQRKVRLPSGGEIVIDRSEALTTIDVNSARATKGADIEATALDTNLEAAKEIAIQLRIRDLGGLFIVDFIDMEQLDNKRKVEEYMYEVLKTDRARTQVGRISRFGLLEMSRQRLRPALNEASQIICTRCHGQGVIRNIQSLALSVIHLIEEKAAKENARQIQLQAPFELATYMINEHRDTIMRIEQHANTQIIVIPNPYLELPHYEIEVIGKGGKGKRKKTRDQESLSYELVKTPKVAYESAEQVIAEKTMPAVKDVLLKTTTPPPKRQHPKKPGLLKRIYDFFFPAKRTQEKPTHTKKYKRKSYKSSRGGKPRSSTRYKQKRSDSYRRSHRSSRTDKGYRSKSTTKTPREEQKRSDNRQQQPSTTPTVKKPQQQAISKPEPAKTEPPKAAAPIKPKEFPKTKIEAPTDMVQVETKREKE
ncbi:MAG: Rne/Rng family ribonuclease [Gammaproteobacteria bacterium]|jgi:ribonuclease E